MVANIHWNNIVLTSNVSIIKIIINDVKNWCILSSSPE